MLRHLVSLTIVLLLAGAASAQETCIGNVFVLPSEPTPLDTITIFAEIGPGVLDVTLIYRFTTDWDALPMTCINDTCRASIGPYPANTNIDYYIQAHDSVGYACYSPPEAPYSFYTLTIGEYPSCPYLPGDINNSGTANGLDVIYFVRYFKGGPPPPVACDHGNGPFFAAADINGDCEINGIDVVYFVLYLKGVGIISYCLDFPPEG